MYLETINYLDIFFFFFNYLDILPYWLGSFLQTHYLFVLK